jgi:hypothetical protein
MSTLPSNTPSQSKRSVKRKENPDGTLTARPTKKTKAQITAAAAATAPKKSKNSSKNSSKKKKKKKTHTTQPIALPPQASTPTSPTQAPLPSTSSTIHPEPAPPVIPPTLSGPKPTKAKTRTRTVTILTEDEEEEAMAASGIDEVIETNADGKETRRPVRRTSPRSSSSGSSSSEDGGSSSSESESVEDEETDEAQLGEYFLSSTSL